MEYCSGSNIRQLLIYASKNKEEINAIIESYNPTSGYIYCISNEIYNFYGSNVYKFGNSSEPDKRLLQYTTSYVKPCTIVKLSNIFFDKNLAETLLFYYLKDYRLVDNREFFKCEKEIYEQAFLDVEKFFELYNTPKEMFNYLLNNLYHPMLCFNSSIKNNEFIKTDSLLDTINNSIIDELLEK